MNDIEQLLRDFVDQNWAGFAGPNHCLQAATVLANKVLADERERARPVIEAARRTENDFDGSLTLGETEIRAAIGNTNFNILVRRLQDIRTRLAAYDAAHPQDWTSPDKIGTCGARCFDCGLPYSDDRFWDLVIDDAAWKQIAPIDGDGLLCPNCICRRLHQRGIECNGRFTSGPLTSPGEMEVK